MSQSPPQGAIAEFTEAEALVAAVRAARAAGWSRLDAHAPHPVPEAAEALGVRAALLRDKLAQLKGEKVATTQVKKPRKGRGRGDGKGGTASRRIPRPGSRGPPLLPRAAPSTSACAPSPSG